MSEEYPLDANAKNDELYNIFLEEHFPQDDASMDTYYKNKSEQILSGGQTFVVRSHESDFGFVLDCYYKAQLAAYIDVDETGIVEVFKADQLSPPAYVDTFDLGSQKENLLAALKLFNLPNS